MNPLFTSAYEISGLGPARHTLGQAAEDAASEQLNLRVRSMAEISMVVTSIAPLIRWQRTRFHHDSILARLMMCQAAWHTRNRDRLTERPTARSHPALPVGQFCHC